ncbi:biopolymer transporter ExbD [Loktanella salsilacus]|jgi:biopolymer transport protein ExbD|uniref:ExbD/TolR family protein n=1 Tax=Loktanella salsilacus TaxID=195913 RepID=UPI0020B884E9|nr:biopolymer transporter ExbD [Loktanella salsilacus]UTH47147.1 biopolymer transporter ExbD [Loktanella salsilacus]
MQLRRRIPSPRLISLVSMVDVLLIMLVFFMVTSTYLNLDMIPMTQSAGGTEGAPNAATPVMIRLGPDGLPYLRGQPLAYDVLSAQLAALPADTPVLILPSLNADTQSLVTLMDVATSAGVRTLRVVQVAAP